MVLRALRLRSVGPPIAVAAMSVAALVWFDKVWIPAQQQYLNERNLRSLKTVAAQIKAKVDNFELAIDHAIDSFPGLPGTNDLQKYVKLFSPELEVVDAARPAAKTVTPGDPPNVRIQREEGRNYLYLGYRHVAERRVGERTSRVVELAARGDIERVAAPDLTRTDFDALLLLDGRGATIAQQSSSGLELTSADKLRDRGPIVEGTPGVFDRVRGTTSLAVVTIGAADYMLYAQPVQLSLMHQGKDGAEGPEEWTLCGLVRLDRFRAASSSIPTTYWLLFGAMLALICFAIPLVKLRVLSPRERLRRVDSVSAAAAVFMMMVLATFAALDVRLFGTIVPAAVDAQLQAVASLISRHVQQEIDAVDKQMLAFGDGDVWHGKLRYGADSTLEAIRSQLTAGADGTLDAIRNQLSADQGAEIRLHSDSARSQCEPAWSCRSGVLSMLGENDSSYFNRIDYPFFKSMAWSDDAGWQRIKWSTQAVVTPFINVDEAKFPYSDSMKLARRLGGHDVATSGVAVVMSPNTGDKLTVFWKSLAAKAAGADRPADQRNDAPGTRGKPDLLGVTMTTTPVSLTTPMLPKNVQFAVLDRTGRVLFHNDSSRSLTENFFQEAEDNPKLKSLVASRDSGALSGRYMGRAHRFHVTPLDVAPAVKPVDRKPFGDPRWSLVVFQDAAVSETANLETINLAVSLFVVYAAALTAIWAVLGACWPGAIAKWMWPAAAKGPQYRRAAAVGSAAAVMCMAALAWLRPAVLVSFTAALIVGAFGAMFVIVRAVAGSPRESSSRWLADFFWARASLLFLLAAVPAMVCFHVAHAFHTELVVKRAQSHLVSDLGARARRINSQAQKTAICTEGDPGNQSCDHVVSFVDRRTRNTLWDVHVPSARKEHTASPASLFDSPVLRSFLMAVYRPYNDIAGDLLMATTRSPGRGLERWPLAVDGTGEVRTFMKADAETGWMFAPAIALPSGDGGALWLIAAALMGVAYVLVRHLLQPLFALDLNPTVPLLAAAGAADDTSLLVVGPGGSRRSERLRRHPRVRIFDVRSLAFTDEPILAMASPARVSSAADSANGMDDEDVNWIESMHRAASQPHTIVAVDHLDHRFDDDGFRRSMLDCLESAVYGLGATIWCGAARDPIEILEETDPPAPDRQRWARLLEPFRRERLGLEIDRSRVEKLERSLQGRDSLPPVVRSRLIAECQVAPELLAIGQNLASRLPLEAPVSEEMVLAEIGSAAAPFYKALWSNCSTDERVVLRQLAEEGLVNPNNRTAASRMMSAGLVHRNPTFCLMNETFRRFVIGAASPQVISTWEHEGVRVPWSTIATTGVTVAFGLAGLLLLTQEQLVDAWISYVPAVAPAIPTVWKVLATVQKGRIDVTA